MINILKPNFVYGDERGMLTQLIREGYKQVNVIESVKGAERGNHYHKLNKEAFFVIRGRLLLHIENLKLSEVNNTEKCRTCEFAQGDMLEILPYVNHSFTFLEDTLLVSLYDQGVELNGQQKDIYQIKNSAENIYEEGGNSSPRI